MVLKERKNKIFWIRTNTTDIDIVESIFLGKEGEWGGEYDFLFKEGKVQSARVIIDAGANIGAFSILADIYCNRAKIIAIEPEKSNYRILRKNTENCSNIECINVGIWKHKAKLEVCKRETGEWGFFVKENIDGDIEAVAITDILERYHIDKIDILKVDIEGSEIEMLTGDCSWLDKVRLMIIETHDRIKPGSTEFIDKKMKVYGFKCNIYGEDRVYYRNL